MAVNPKATAGEVKAILSRDYDSDSLPSLTPYIRSAAVLMVRVVECAVTQDITLSDDEQREIENWLAAHFYTRSDKAYASNSTGGASASYQGQTGMHLDGSFYGQTAKMLDYSGCLTDIEKAVIEGGRSVARGHWLGYRKSEQTDYLDRD